MMEKLVMIRHGESEWNKQNLFTGWSDVDLSETGRKEAREAGRLLSKEGLDFDVCYASFLNRSIHTAYLIKEEMDQEWIDVVHDWHLNERHYGEEQVRIWRRSYKVASPALKEDDPRASLVYTLSDDLRRIESRRELGDAAMIGLARKPSESKAAHCGDAAFLHDSSVRKSDGSVSKGSLY